MRWISKIVVFVFVSFHVSFLEIYIKSIYSIYGVLQEPKNNGDKWKTTCLPCRCMEVYDKTTALDEYNTTVSIASSASKGKKEVLNNVEDMENEQDLNPVELIYLWFLPDIKQV